MIKDVNVTQISELRVFAHSSSRFGDEIVCFCQQGINAGDDAFRSADYYRNTVRRKVEAAESELQSAQRALDEYERQDHTDSEGNSTYDYSHTAQLQTAVEDARRKLANAKEDQDHVMERYNRVKQEVSDMTSALSSSIHSASNAADIAYRQISTAASILEQDYTNSL